MQTPFRRELNQSNQSRVARTANDDAKQSGRERTTLSDYKYKKQKIEEELNLVMYKIQNLIQSKTKNAADQSEITEIQKQEQNLVDMYESLKSQPCDT